MAFTELPPDAQLDGASEPQAPRFTELPADAQLDQPQGQQTGADRFGQGLRDPVDAGAQLAVHSLPSGAVNAVNSATKYVNDLPVVGPVTKALGMVPATQEQLDTGIADREKKYQADRAAAGGSGIDWARMGGNLVSTLPIAAAGGVPGTIGQAARIGATTGAAFGALTPVTNQEDPFWSQKATQTAVGAGTGLLAAPVTYGASRLLQPEVSSQVRTLMDRGVTPTPGQIMGGAAQRTEEKLTSVPILGDMIKGAQRRGVEQLNRAAYNETLAPIGGKSMAELGREGVGDVQQQLKTAYNDLLPRLTFQADQQFGSEIGNLTQMASNLPPQQASRFGKIIQEQVVSKLGPNGTMDGQTFKGVESEIGNLVKGYRSDGSFENRQLGNALGEVLTSMRGALTRANPNDAPQLQAINRAYSMFAKVRDASSRVGTDEGVFSPAQLLSAVRSGDRSAGKGAFATGNAQMQELADAGRTVLGSKYPDSGTAGRQILAAGGGLLAGGGAAAINPVAGLAVGASLLPYTALGQHAAAHLLAGDRGAARVLTGPLADAIRAATVPSVGVARGLLSPQ